MGSSRGTLRFGAGVAVALATATLLLAACGGNEEGALSVDGGGGREAARAPEPMGLQESALEESSTAPAAALPPLGPSVIKTADVTLEVGRGDLDEVVGDAVAVAGRFGGFVLTSTVEQEGRGTGTVVLRVPAGQFEAALGAVEELGDVEAKTISGQDVTEEFIDLEARRRNLQAQEAVLLRLMRRARTIPGTIRVQQELQRIQLEVERIEGRLRFLRDQTELSTITAEFEEAGPAPAPAGTLARAWARARAGFLAIISALIVGAGTVLPVAVLAGLVFVGVRLVAGRLTAESRS
jgi:hypothetical protein